ncbi:unnamed protein product [Cuscuta campestris]|uniref:Uncharacterized protein n=1 Tax=Cuscuta campestris TaxID=132261 RepID=A0A484MQK5_9ASTE|nr:unnamed protein product [Cuscuta campestris]
MMDGCWLEELSCLIFNPSHPPAAIAATAAAVVADSQSPSRDCCRTYDLRIGASSVACRPPNIIPILIFWEHRGLAAVAFRCGVQLQSPMEVTTH